MKTKIFLTVSEVKRLPDNTPVLVKYVGHGWEGCFYEEKLHVKRGNYLFCKDGERILDLNRKDINMSENFEIKCYVEKDVFEENIINDSKTYKVHKAFKDILKAHSSEEFDAAVKDLNEQEAKRVLKMTVEYLNILVMNVNTVY